MSTERPTYLARPADRILNAFRIACDTYAVTLAADLHGRIRVSVATLPMATGGYGLTLTQGAGGAPDFAIDEIALRGDRLECLAMPPCETAPFFRSGFTLDLTPGMHDSIADALTRLTAVVRASLLVCETLDGLLAQHTGIPEHQRQVDAFNYMHSAAEDAIAWVVLDGEQPQSATDRAFRVFEGGSSWDRSGSVFKDCLVQALMAAPPTQVGPIATRA